MWEDTDNNNIYFAYAIIPVVLSVGILFLFRNAFFQKELWGLAAVIALICFLLVFGSLGSAHRRKKRLAQLPSLKITTNEFQRVKKTEEIVNTLRMDDVYSIYINQQQPGFIALTSEKEDKIVHDSLTDPEAVQALSKLMRNQRAHNTKATQMMDLMRQEQFSCRITAINSLLTYLREHKDFTERKSKERVFVRFVNRNNAV